MAKNIDLMVNLRGNITDLENKVKLAKDGLSKIVDTNSLNKLEKVFETIARDFDKLKANASSGNVTSKTFTEMLKGSDKIHESLTGLMRQVADLKDLTADQKISILPDSEQTKLKGAIAALEQFNKTLEETNKKSTELVKAQGAIDKARQNQTAAASNLEFLKSAKEKANTKLREGRKRQTEITDKISAFDGKKITVGSDEDKELQKLKNQLIATNEEVKESNANFTQLRSKVINAGAALNKANTNVKLAEEEYEKLNGQLDSEKLNALQSAYDGLRKAAGAMGMNLKKIPLDYTAENAEQLKQALIHLKDKGLNKVDRELDTFIQKLNDAGQENKDLAKDVREGAKAVKEQDEAMARLDSIKDRIKEFLGFTGAAIIMRKAIQNAMQTVKELDAVMTEMAVVTDLGVGDYWQQLPEYTKRANELGVSIHSVYESATLYYQQGLKTNEVTKISNETLKMAKIAGMDAAEATDKMTAALRGFNMEINETNAQRINDVYSELAAITASDTKEISTAMTKTASIAHSANMEFETTAAFLSQIIETTRESAETAGTAMKTVIARFQELQKDPSKIGEVEGEVIDANKIETALRSVGVALRDNNGQFRALDKVFLELSSKWDSLETNTQRYIATIAAGSRQQSRFIAMMSDYERTMQLVNAAHNSAGASQKQFDKTLESMESKLNKLRNAWDSFTMGLLNSDFIKKGVDLLTQLITSLNEISNGVTFLGKTVNSVTSSISKIGIIITLFKAGKALFTKLQPWVESQFKKLGDIAGQSFAEQLLNKIDGSLKQAESKINGTKQKIAGSTTSPGAPQKSGQPTMMDTIFSPFKKIKNKKRLQSNLANAQAHEQAIQEQLNGINVTEHDVASSRGLIGSSTKQENSLLKKFNESSTAFLDGGAKHAKGLISDEAFELLRKEHQEAEKQLQTQKQITANARKTYDENAKQMKKRTELENEFQKAQEQTAKAQDDFNKNGKVGLTDFANSASMAGEALVGIGMSLNMFASFFDEIGLPEVADVLRNIGGFIVAIGSALMIIPPILMVINMLTESNPILLVISLVIAGIMMIIALTATLISNFSKTKRMKKLQESLERAKEAAQAAKEAYDELFSARDEYNDMQKQLDGLVEGTKAWQEQLVKANAQVLDLIEKYPELSQYLQMGENGSLEIDSAGWNAVLQKQKDQYLRSQLEIANNQNEYIQAQLDELKRQREKGEISLSKYLNETKTLKLQRDASYKSAYASQAEAGNLISNNANQFAADYASQQIHHTGDIAFGMDQMNKGIESGIFDVLLGPLGVLGSQLNWFDKIGGLSTQSVFLDNLYAETVKGGKSKSDKKQAREIYEAINGKDSAKELTTEQVYKAVLDYQIAQNQSKQLKGLNKYLNGQDSATGRIMSGLLNNTTAMLTVAEIQNETFTKAKDALITEMEKLGYDKKYVQEIIAENIKQGNKQIKNFDKDTYGTFIDKTQTVLTVDAMNSLLSTFEKYGVNEKDSDLITNISTLITGNTADKNGTLASIFAGIDWSNQKELVGLKATLKALNIQIGLTDTEFDNLINSLSETAQALYQIDFSKLTNQVTSLQNLVTGIESGEQTNKFSAELFQILSNVVQDPSLINSFKQIGENYYYTGGNSGALKEAILNGIGKDRGLVGSIYQRANSINAVVGAKKKIQFTDKSTGNALDLSKYGEFSTAAKRTIVQKIQDAFGENFNWQAAGFNKIDDLENADDGQLNSFLDKYINLEGVDQNTTNAAVSELLSLDSANNLKSAILNNKIDADTKELYEQALIKKATDSGVVSQDLISSYLKAEAGDEKNGFLNAIVEQLNLATPESEAMDALIELQNKAYDELVRSREEQIDKLEALNSSVLDSRDKMVSSIQKAVNEERQARKNQKTEENIANLSSKLTYSSLTASPTGNMAMLETGEQLDNAVENYQDSLIDQSLQNLQDVNQEMRDELELQTEAMRESLRLDQENGTLMNEAATTVNELKDEFSKGTLTVEKINMALGVEKGSSGENAKSISGSLALLNAATGFNDNNTESQAFKDLIGVIQNQNNDANTDYNGVIDTTTLNANKPQINATDTNTDFWSNWDGDKADTIKVKYKDKEYSLKAYHESHEKQQNVNQNEIQQAYKNYYGDDAVPAIGDLFQHGSNWYVYRRVRGKETRWSLISQNSGDTGFFTDAAKAFATGGLADFTGPAWLDGTKSSPELVLNAQDTKNFIALKDILAGIHSNGGDIANSSNQYVDVDINVDSIGSDYDVDKLARQVKSIIYNDASYRNVNTVSKIK